jgi:Xaa-Pro aminopeptidase
VSRADRVAARLAGQGLDLLLVTGLTNVRYLTGYTGTNGLAVVGAGTRRFLTDFRYVEQAAAQVTDFDRETVPRDLRLGLGDGWPQGPVRLGFEDQHVSVRHARLLRETLPDRVALVPAGGLVEAERAVKEPGELTAIRAAAALTDEVYELVAAQGVVGRTEREIAIALEQEMRVRGGEGPAFASIVASGLHGAQPHALPRDVPVERGVLVTLDIGAKVDGYCADCTRTWATGELPDELAEIHALVLRAQEAGVAAIRPGLAGREVDAVAREVVEAAGYGEQFGHGLGHGVGLEVHEDPRLAQTSEDRLAPGQVVTVEPGIYVPGRGGARIEDLVVVTEEGCDVLTATTKAPRVVA